MVNHSQAVVNQGEQACQLLEAASQDSEPEEHLNQPGCARTANHPQIGKDKFNSKSI
jgi:hypothetical protein